MSVNIAPSGWGGKHGRVDALSNDDINALFALNVNGTILRRREAIRRMSTQYGDAGGSIINFADEVTNAVLWLASEQASYVTGVILDVSGAR